MRSRVGLLGMIGLLALGACGSTRQLYGGPPRPRNEVATIDVHESCSGAHVSVTGVAGEPIRESSGRVAVLPGTYRLDLEVYEYRTEKSCESAQEMVTRTATEAAIWVPVGMVTGEYYGTGPSVGRTVRHVRWTLSVVATVKAGHHYRLCSSPPAKPEPKEHLRESGELLAKWESCWMFVGYVDMEHRLWLCDETALRELS